MLHFSGMLHSVPMGATSLFVVLEMDVTLPRIIPTANHGKICDGHGRVTREIGGETGKPISGDSF